MPAPPHLKDARAIHEANAAHRALGDPALLRRATRIVRAALAAELLEIGDLTPLYARATKGMRL
jgi:hypothetical protein